MITVAANYWIKLYLEILDDPKMGRLPDRLYRRAIEFFLLAGDYGEDGRLPPVGDIAWRLRLSDEEVKLDLQELAKVRIVTQTDTGWVVTNFSRRQAAASGAERQQAYRDRKRKRQYYGASNGSVTNRYVESDVDSDSDSDSDVVATTTPESQLSAAFVNATGIPELTGGPKRWFDAAEEMARAGVKPEDVVTAVQELRDKNYQIISLRSIVNPAINAMSKRIRGNSTNGALPYPRPPQPTPDEIREGLRNAETF